jgi:uncharacterized membrane protein YfcA
MLPDPLLILLGIAVGTVGTLVGAGGGFVLVPLLAILDPALATAGITGVSLAVVAMNAMSGALAYARERRIDYRSGIPFALATFPGSILGALATKFLERRYFDIAFAVLLLGLAVLLIRRGEAKSRAETAEGTDRHPDVRDRDGERGPHPPCDRPVLRLSPGRDHRALRSAPSHLSADGDVRALRASGS